MYAGLCREKSLILILFRKPKAQTPAGSSGLAPDYGSSGFAASVIQTDVAGGALRFRLAHLTWVLTAYGHKPAYIYGTKNLSGYPYLINSIAKALKITPADLFTDVDSSKTVKIKTSQQKRKSQLKTKILKAIDEAF